MAEIIPWLFLDVQNRLKKFVEGGQLGIFRMATGGTRSTNCRQKPT